MTLGCLAPPARPIAGLQLTTAGVAVTADKMSTTLAGVPVTAVGGTSTSSKSVPATPVSTPMTEQQPTGVMARIFGSGKNTRPPVSNEPTAGSPSLLLDDISK